MTAIGNAIGIPFMNRRIGAIPFISDLIFDYKTRTDLTLVDTIAGANASVVGGEVGLFDGIASSFEVNRYIVGQSPIYIKRTFILSKVTGVQTLFLAGGYSGGIKGILILTAVNSIEIYSSNGTTGIKEITITPTLLIDTIYNLEFSWDGMAGSTATVTLNGTPYTYTAVKDWTGNSGTKVNIGQYAAGQFFYGLTTYFELINNSITSKFYFNNAINSVDGIAATIAGVTFAPTPDYDTPSTLTALTEGYYQETATGKQVVDPQYALPVGWVEHLGGTLHNLINSYIEFPSGTMDRSSATIFNATCRASIYYDSGRPTLWHISEFSQYTFGTYINVGYAGKYYNKFTTNSIDARLFMTEFFGYATDKTYNSEIKILKYTNDITKAIDDGAGSYIVDANGYVVLTN